MKFPFLSRKLSAGPTRDEKLVLVGGMSRSGTTLLSCVLDAHPAIAAGAELIPTDIPDLAKLREAIEAALSESDDFSLTGRHVRKHYDKALGGFVTRCYRAGSSADDVLATIDHFLEQGHQSVDQFEDRFFLAVNVIDRRRQREDKEFGSFKANTPTLLPVLSQYPNAYIICLVRHPADVVHSHFKNDFGRTSDQICTAWVRYIKAFEDARSQFGDRVAIVKYEDFVADPEAILGDLFEMIPLEMDARMLKYEETDSKILNSRHPNTDTLKRGIVTDAVGAGSREDDSAIAETVARKCGTQMRDWGYVS